MATDYRALKQENVGRYGTDIGEVGKMLLADRYEERTHFIFELLQNAEDALRRRVGWTGSREVNFDLVPGELRVSHYGQPFTPQDVRGICSIGKSTKNITEIGRFGIGFKSVYVYSTSPEIHSGGENFAIDSYVWPRPVHALARHPDQTLIRLPIDADDADEVEVEAGLRSLNARALLFLREIERVTWRAGGLGGTCQRLELGSYGEMGRRVRLVRREGDITEESDWLVFSKPVFDDDNIQRGFAEVAFEFDAVTERVVPVSDSNLVVFFPTALPAHCGFLIQAPFKTTPSRDNIPKADDWNKRLVGEVSELLVAALQALSASKLLNLEVLQCLPLDRLKLPDTHMLGPLFVAVKEAFKTLPILPTLRGGYTDANHAKIGRTAEVRRLFSSAQLGVLFDLSEPVYWLDEGITQDRTPELRRYLMMELGVDEVTPEALFPKISKPFLEQQSDPWTIQLYGVLLNLPALLKRLSSLPWVRLEDGSHVTARLAGQPQAFLPTDPPTEFPTVKAQLAKSPQARSFLAEIGVTAPDPIDEVILHVLPRYVSGTAWKADAASDRQYETDIAKILAANASDSTTKRAQLIGALRTAQFVRAVGLTDERTRVRVVPGATYLATARLKSLFKGVPNVYVVDDRLPCLRGEDIRNLLETCGAARHLQQVPTPSTFTYEQKRQMRISGGCEDISRADAVSDYTLRGLNELLALMQTLPLAEAAERGKELWESLRDFLERRGQYSFEGSYTWFYHYSREHRFAAAFVRKLCNTEWVVSGDALVPPTNVDFEQTNWSHDAALLALIPFRPAIVTQLAEQVGIEAEALDLLKALGVTSAADLRARLRLDEEMGQDEAEISDDSDEQTSPSADANVQRNGGGSGEAGPRADGRGGTNAGANDQQTGTGAGRSEFVSYVAVHDEADHHDPDSLSAEQRMALEDFAIEAILEEEPSLKRTSAGNAGFDLYEVDANNRTVRWVEVKAMKGTLADRPVGLSRAQFVCAQEHLDHYWLYVVERAGTPGAQRIVRIRNPAGRGSTFTFDAGWANAAEAAPRPAELAR